MVDAGERAGTSALEQLVAALDVERHPVGVLELGFEARLGDAGLDGAAAGLDVVEARAEGELAHCLDSAGPRGRTARC